MAVHDRLHFRAHRVDLAMDEALEIRIAHIALLYVRGEVVGLDVSARDELRRERTRQEVAVGAVRMANADVAEAIEDPEPGKDAVGGDEIVEQGVESGH